MERFAEQIAEVVVPQMEERISERIAEQIVDVTMPRKGEQLVVRKFVSRDILQQRADGQIFDFPLPKVEQIADGSVR